MDAPLLSITDQLDQIDQNHHILIVDDDHAVLEYYREIFEPEESRSPEIWQTFVEIVGDLETEDTLKSRCVLATASSGEEGVELVKQALVKHQPYSVAFVDMRMPGGMDGLETAQCLREIDSRIMLVIVTAYTDYQIEEIQKRLQHDVLFLNKPLSVDEVKQTARTLNQNWKDREKKKVLELQMVSQAKMAALGNMAVRIGHEINQPLSYINGILQLQKMELDSGAELDLQQLSGEVELALEQTVRIKEIIDSLRVFAHPDKLHREAVSLAEVVENAQRIFRGRLEAQRITCHVELDEALPTLHGNASQLQRILTNLISNAVDALVEQRDVRGSEWCAEISLHAKVVPGKKYVEIVFADNGAGVPESLRERMFDPFVTTKEPGKGTGLGLSEIHGMLKEHGASIEYCPDPNREGARFVILFPTDEEESDE